MRKLWAVLAVLILLVALLLSTSGWFLVVNNPQHADVIVALAGETDRRPSRALELLRAGYAPRLQLDVPAAAKITTVKEGNEFTREDADNCGTVATKGGAAAAKGPILTSNTAKWTAVGAGAALTIWTLTRHENPVSPDAP
jgi:hypothetical protein